MSDLQLTEETFSQFSALCFIIFSTRCKVPGPQDFWIICGLLSIESSGLYGHLFGSEQQHCATTGLIIITRNSLDLCSCKKHTSKTFNFQPISVWEGEKNEWFLQLFVVRDESSRLCARNKTVCTFSHSFDCCLSEQASVLSRIQRFHSECSDFGCYSGSLGFLLC